MLSTNVMIPSTFLNKNLYPVFCPSRIWLPQQCFLLSASSIYGYGIILIEIYKIIIGSIEKATFVRSVG